MNEHPRRGSLVGPFILIALGVVLLLNNIGYLNWDVWLVVLRLWPLILIGIGLDILIGRRSPLGSLAVLLVMILLFGGALYYFGVLGRTTGTPLMSQTINQPLPDAGNANITLAPGVATLRLGSIQELGTQALTPVLIQGTVATGNSERVTQHFDMNGNTAQYELRGQGPALFPFVGTPNGSARWDLQLTPAVPLDLQVNSGVGDTNLNLTGLKLTALDLSAGVGKVGVTLPAHGVFQVKVSGGIGDLAVQIPQGLAARIHVSTGLGGVSVPSAYQHQGDTYISPNYDSAADRVDLQVSGGIGQVSILAGVQE